VTTESTEPVTWYCQVMSTGRSQMSSAGKCLRLVCSNRSGTWGLVVLMIFIKRAADDVSKDAQSSVGYGVRERLACELTPIKYTN